MNPRDNEKNAVLLRNVVESDLPVFFEQQLDPVASHMAAFTRNEPADREAFMARWTRILGDDSVTIRTILCDGQVAGSVASFVDKQLGEPEVTYWIGNEYWGRGIATKALSKFLSIQTTRPLYARAAKDNIASIRVLEKCEFKISGYDKGFANARGAEIEEVVMTLE